MRVHADSGVCVGAGQCALTAPTIFDQDEDGLVVVLEAEPAADGARARDAASLCPARAITVTDP